MATESVGSGRKQSCAFLTKENLWNSLPHMFIFNQTKVLRSPKMPSEVICSEAENLRAIFRENRKSQDTRKKMEFFFFCQNIPFSDLIQEKIVLGSSDSLYGRNNK